MTMLKSLFIWSLRQNPVDLENPKSALIFYFSLYSIPHFPFTTGSTSFIKVAFETGELLQEWIIEPKTCIFHVPKPFMVWKV